MQSSCTQPQREGGHPISLRGYARSFSQTQITNTHLLSCSLTHCSFSPVRQTWGSRLGQWRSLFLQLTEWRRKKKKSMKSNRREKWEKSDACGTKIRNIYAIQKKCAAAVTVFNTYTAIVPIVSGLLQLTKKNKWYSQSCHLWHGH